MPAIIERINASRGIYVYHKFFITLPSFLFIQETGQKNNKKPGQVRDSGLPWHPLHKALPKMVECYCDLHLGIIRKIVMCTH